MCDVEADSEANENAWRVVTERYGAASWSAKNKICNAEKHCAWTGAKAANWSKVDDEGTCTKVASIDGVGTKETVIE